MHPRDNNNLRPRSGEVRQTATYVLGCSDAQWWLAQTTASDVLESWLTTTMRDISPHRGGQPSSQTVAPSQIIITQELSGRPGSLILPTLQAANTGNKLDMSAFSRTMHL